MYGPEAFGIAAIFMSITGIIGVIACLRYEMAILLPEKDEEAVNILGLCLILSAVVSILTVPMIWLSKESLLQMLKAPELASYIWLIPPSIFLSGIFTALNYWNSRTRRFGRLSLARIYASMSTTTTQIVGGVYLYPTSGTLIKASIIGSAISTIVLGWQIWRDDRKVLKDNICYKGIQKGLVRYRKFGHVDTITALLNNISWQLPVFLMSFFFSVTEAGLYTLCTSLLHFPMNLIGNSIGQVFFQRAVDAKSEGTLGVLVENVFRMLVVLSLFPFLMLTLIGRDLFVSLFGVAWAEAGVYAQILGIWSFVWFISSPLAKIYLVLEKQEFGLNLNLINFISRFMAIVLGGFLGNPRVSVLLFAISGMFVYTYLILAILRFSGVPIFKAVGIVFENFKIFAPAGMAIIALKALSFDGHFLVIFSILLIVFYYILIAIRDPLISKIINLTKD